MPPRVTVRLGVLALLIALCCLEAQGATSRDDRLKKQQAENLKWEGAAKSDQSKLFQKAEQLFGEKNLKEAAKLYLRVQQVVYPQWELQVYSVPVTSGKGTTKLLGPGTTVVPKLLVTDLNDKAGEKLAKMGQAEQTLTLEAAFEEAEELLKQNKPGLAYAQFQRLAADGLPIEFQQKYQKQARKRLAEIEKQAKAVLAELRAALEKRDVVKARAAGEKLCDQFGQLQDCPALQQEYAQILQSDQFQDVLREEAAAEKLKAGLALLEKEELAGGFDALKDIVTRSPDTAAAQEASTRLQQLMADKAAMRVIANQRAAQYCEEVMRKAQNFLANGRLDEAEKLYKRVLERFPGTDYADQAAEALKKIEDARNGAKEG